MFQSLNAGFVLFLQQLLLRIGLSTKTEGRSFIYFQNGNRYCHYGIQILFMVFATMEFEK
jgi:hypothetical protein